MRNKKKKTSKFFLIWQDSNQLIDSDFQLTYTFKFLGLVVLALLISSLPALYFLNKNYALFIDLALSYSPDLLPHLEREQKFMNVLTSITIFTVLIGTYYLCLKITRRIALPLFLLKQHIKSLTRGQWDMREIELLEDQEFYDLIEAYVYFHRNLKYQNQSEIDRLKMIEPKDEKAKRIWEDLLNEKRQRVSENVGSADQAASKHPFV